LLVSQLCLGGLVQADSTADDSAVVNLLRGYEWQLDMEALSALPVDSWKILLNIAASDVQPVYLKSRALEALAQFPNDQVWTFLESEVATADTVERRRLVESLCATFSSLRPAQVEAVISEFLVANDAHLRIVVAKCLQNIGSESALAKINQYKSRFDKSSDSWEQRALD
jgi:hypothetical protein